jgi:hypothetical protein
VGREDWAVSRLRYVAQLLEEIVAMMGLFIETVLCRCGTESSATSAAFAQCRDHPREFRSASSPTSSIDATNCPRGSTVSCYRIDTAVSPVAVRIATARVTMSVVTATTVMANSVAASRLQPCHHTRVEQAVTPVTGSWFERPVSWRVIIQNARLKNPCSCPCPLKGLLIVSTRRRQ